MLETVESNIPLMATAFACVLAQALKIVTYWYKDKKWDIRRMLQSGGMPSSHAAAVMSLSGTIGLRSGFTSDVFAIAIVFAAIVMYDASGVRLHAGKQAAVLNQIIFELPPEHPVSESRPVLRDTIGHTPMQVVAGAVLGLFVGYVFHIMSLKTPVWDEYGPNGVTTIAETLD